MKYLILAILTSEAINRGYGYAIAFLLIVVAFQLFDHRRVLTNFVLSSDFWILFLACLSFVLIGKRDFSALYHYVVLPILAFAIGWCAVEGGREEAVDLVLALIAGYAAHAVLNDIANIGNESRYTLIDCWTGRFRAATGSGVLNTMTVSILPYMVATERRWFIRLGYFTALMLTLHYMFILGTRTQFFILLIVGAVFGIFGAYKKAAVPGVAVFILSVATAILFVLFLYKNNAFGLGNWFDGTNLASRYSDSASLSSSDSFRIQSLWSGLTELVEYPFGGRGAQYYRHNMWLDVGRISGILPFALLVLYSAQSFARVLRMYRNRGLSDNLPSLLLPLYLGMYINFFVEPIWEGQLSFFLSSCLLDGITSQIERANS